MKRRKAGRTAVEALPQQQAVMVDLPEVLELVLSCADDAALLCKATTVSTYYKDLVLTRIQQHLPELLVCAVKQLIDATTGLDRQDHQVNPGSSGFQQVLVASDKNEALLKAQAHAKAAAVWLCAVAGRDAVAQQQVTDALLSPGMVVAEQVTSERQSSRPKRVWAWAPFVSALAVLGLRMAEAALVSAAQQQLPPLGECLNLCYDTTGPDRLCEAVLLNDRGALLKRLKDLQPSGDRILGLMFVAANEGAQRSMRCLVEYDKLNTQVLVGVASATAAAGRRNSTGNSPGINTPQGQTRRQQQQVNMQQQQEARLQQLEKLLLTCLTAKQMDILYLLTDEAPAVALLGEAQLARLLQAAALLGNPRIVMGSSLSASAFQALCDLAAAQFVSGAAIVNVLRLLLLNKCRESCDWQASGCRSLLNLPGTDSINSSQLCSLLRLACNMGVDGVAGCLAKLAAQRDLPHGVIMQLLYTLLEEQPATKFMDTLDMLQPLKFWTHMSDAEVVDVLVRVTLKCDIWHVADHIREGMTAFHFKKRRFTDVASYVRFIKHIYTNCSPDEDSDLSMFSLRFLTASYAPQLGVQDCIELLRYSVLETCGYVPSSLTRLPAAKDIPADEVYALMQLCMHQRPPHVPYVYSSALDDADAAQPPAPRSVAYLVQIPAARDLSAAQVSDILQLCMRQEDKPEMEALVALLRLPAAQHIGTAKARGLLSAALDWGCMDIVKMLCQRVPACAVAWRHWDTQQLAQRLDALLQKTGPRQIPQQAEVSALLNHPSLQQHVQQILPQLLLSAFTCVSKPVGVGCPNVDKDSVADLQALLQLPAAQTLPAAVLRQLMQHSLLHMGGAFIPELLRPPAAAQLQQGDVAVLLQAALGRPCAGDSSRPGVGAAQDGQDAELSGQQRGGQRARPKKQQRGRGQHAKQQQQQQQQQQHKEQQQGQQQLLDLEGSAVGSDHCASLPGLLQECVQHAAAAPLLFQLLTLPWVRQLPAAALKGLLVAAAERQYKALFQGLLQQPQAPRDDAEVQSYVDHVRLTAGAPVAEPSCWVPPSRSPQQQRQHKWSDSSSCDSEPPSSVYDSLSDALSDADSHSDTPSGSDDDSGSSDDDKSESEEEGAGYGHVYAIEHPLGGPYSDGSSQDEDLSDSGADEESGGSE